MKYDISVRLEKADVEVRINVTGNGLSSRATVERAVTEAAECVLGALRAETSGQQTL